MPTRSTNVVGGGTESRQRTHEEILGEAEGGEVMAKKTKRRGPPSLFSGKRRAPVSLTLTPAHHTKVRNATTRLDLTRADLIGLLIEKYADTLTTAIPDAYKELRDAVEVLGGTLARLRPRITWGVSDSAERIGRA